MNYEKAMSIKKCPKCYGPVQRTGTIQIKTQMDFYVGDDGKPIIDTDTGPKGTYWGVTEDLMEMDVYEVLRDQEMNFTEAHFEVICPKQGHDECGWSSWMDIVPDGM